VSRTEAANARARLRGEIPRVNSPTGSIDVTCDVRGGRSRVTSLRSTGLSRSSRAFAERDGAVRIVLATLGPGVLAGDRFELSGRVSPRAALAVRGQMATPVFAGSACSRWFARWRVADRAVLDAVNEPLVLEAGSEHLARTEVEVEGDGIAILAEVVAARGPASLSARTAVWLDGRFVLRDALALSGDSFARALGTIVVVAREAALREAIAREARRLCSEAGGEGRAGLGETQAAVVVRIQGDSLWETRLLAHAVGDTARQIATRG
jgi:urease accessory protein UreH